MHRPTMVPRATWHQARLDLLQAEKEATRARDALNARRRRLPMTEIEHDYVFQTHAGPRRLVELFDGRDQLIVYHNMLTADHICPGCSMFSDNLANHLEHLHARRTTFVMVARATLARIEAVKARMGWRFPWVSCEGTHFHEDFVTAQDGAPFGLSVFLRDGERVFQTYFTSGRGVELASNHFNLLDLTPWGRQEAWEDSPAGTPQEPTHSWVRLHDEYGAA